MNISRRNFIQNSSLALGATLLPWQQLFAFGKAEYKMQLLRNDVGIFSERGGTIAWRIAEDGVVVVDTQFPDQAGHLIEEIKKKTGRQVDLLINTHHHGDHSGGNIAFKGFAKKIVAHKNSKANQERVAKDRGIEAKQLYPDTIYESTWSEKVGTETMSLSYFGAGHTNGDSFIHFENANIVHTGDLMFNRRFPFIDRSAGASISNWVEVLESAIKKFDNDTLFVFGHAFDPEKITGTKEDLKAMQNYLAKLLVFVKKEIKAGKDREGIQSARSIPGAEEWQGRGIERSLTSAYDELKAGK